MNVWHLKLNMIHIYSWSVNITCQWCFLITLLFHYLVKIALMSFVGFPTCTMAICKPRAPRGGKLEVDRSVWSFWLFIQQPKGLKKVHMFGRFKDVRWGIRSTNTEGERWTRLCLKKQLLRLACQGVRAQGHGQGQGQGLVCVVRAMRVKVSGMVTGLSLWICMFCFFFRLSLLCVSNITWNSRLQCLFSFYSLCPYHALLLSFFLWGSVSDFMGLSLFPQ